MEAQTPDRRRVRTGLAIMAAAGLGLVVAVPSSVSAGEADVQPRLVEGDPTCADVQPGGEEAVPPDRLGRFEARFAPPSDGEHTDGGLRVRLTLSEEPDGQLLDWNSEPIGLDGVIVKGGPNANVYEYDPEATEDSGLHAPTNPQDEQFFDISRVSFCYDFVISGPLPPPPPLPPTTQPEPERPVAPAVEAQPTFTG